MFLCTAEPQDITPVATQATSSPNTTCQDSDCQGKDNATCNPVTRLTCLYYSYLNPYINLHLSLQTRQPTVPLQSTSRPVADQQVCQEIMLIFDYSVHHRRVAVFWFYTKTQEKKNGTWHHIFEQ